MPLERKQIRPEISYPFGVQDRRLNPITRTAGLHLYAFLNARVQILESHRGVRHEYVDRVRRIQDPDIGHRIRIKSHFIQFFNGRLPGNDFPIIGLGAIEILQRPPF